MDIQVGDILKLKKPHPCGGYTWEVLRIGADFRIKCTTCGHSVMVGRNELMKRTKSVQKQTGTGTAKD